MTEHSLRVPARRKVASSELSSEAGELRPSQESRCALRASGLLDVVQHQRLRRALTAGAENTSGWQRRSRKFTVRFPIIACRFGAGSGRSRVEAWPHSGGLQTLELLVHRGASVSSASKVRTRKTVAMDRRRTVKSS